MHGEITTICVDVGNSETHIGLVRDEELTMSKTFVTPSATTADALLIMLENLGLDKLEKGTYAILACVVPALHDAWAQALDQLECVKRTFVVGPGLKNGLTVKVNDPSQIGADRIADCVATKQLYGAPVIVVDLGTTTNINVIDKDGALAGGLIAPGMRTSASAAFDAAAQLSEVTLTAPASAIGKTTREAMQAGIVLGEAARIKGLVALVEEELGYECSLVLTGSDATSMEKLLNRECIVDEALTLRGLGMICLKNVKR